MSDAPPPAAPSAAASPPPAGPSSGAPAGARAILSPGLDLLVIGGLWVLLGLPLLVLGVPDAVERWCGERAMLLTTLLNVPHFMGSYWLLYRSRELVRRHPWASFGVPGALVLYGAVVVALHGSHPWLLTLLQGVGGAYLAWHYTGQAWGMMAVYAHVDGFQWSALERGLVRLGLRLLLAWHVLWFLRIGAQTPRAVREALTTVRPGLDALALLSVPLGLAAFALLRRRTGRLPSARALVPWVAVHLWYVALWRTPAALVWVQLGHALQYLPFPARVELNRHLGEGPARLAGRAAVQYAVLLLVGVTVFELVPRALAGPGRLLGGDAGVAVLPAVVSVIVNVHHYFTDGCVWKVSNPEVRRELLAHLPKSPAPVAPAAAGA